MFGINEVVYKRMLHYFKQHPDIKKVTLFGSRAKDMHNSHSDIDLCIDVANDLRGSLVLDLQELVGIYSCDILFEDKLTGEIKNQVQRDGIVIYQHNGIRNQGAFGEATRHKK